MPPTLTATATPTAEATLTALISTRARTRSIQVSADPRAAAPVRRTCPRGRRAPGRNGPSRRALGFRASRGKRRRPLPHPRVRARAVAGPVRSRRRVARVLQHRRRKSTLSGTDRGLRLITALLPRVRRAPTGSQVRARVAGARDRALAARDGQIPGTGRDHPTPATGPIRATGLTRGTVTRGMGPTRDTVTPGMEPTRGTDPTRDTDPTRATDPTRDTDPTRATDPTRGTETPGMDLTRGMEPTSGMNPMRDTDPTPGTPLPVRISDGHSDRVAQAAEGDRVTQPARGVQAGQAAHSTVQTGIGTVPGMTALMATGLTSTALTGTGPASTVRWRTPMARPGNHTPARAPTLPAGIHTGPHTGPRQRAIHPRRPAMAPRRPGTGPAPGRRTPGRTGQVNRVPATDRPRQAGRRLAR
jgi:hypothetical protein